MSKACRHMGHEPAAKKVRAIIIKCKWCGDYLGWDCRPENYARLMALNYAGEALFPVVLGFMMCAIIAPIVGVAML